MCVCPDPSIAYALYTKKTSELRTDFSPSPGSSCFLYYLVRDCHGETEKEEKKKRRELRERCLFQRQIFYWREGDYFLLSSLESPRCWDCQDEKEEESKKEKKKEWRVGVDVEKKRKGTGMLGA